LGKICRRIILTRGGRSPVLEFAFLGRKSCRLPAMAPGRPAPVGGDRGERLLHGIRWGLGPAGQGQAKRETTPIPSHGPPGCPTRPDTGEGNGLPCSLNAHLCSFRHSPARGHGRGLRFHYLQPARAQITISPFLPPFRPTLWGIVWGINLEAKRKGPLGGLKLLICFGGRWATRTPGLWFRRPKGYIYPPIPACLESPIFPA